MGRARTPRKSAAAQANGAKGGRPRAEKRTFDDLTELTGHESGCIVYEDGTTVVMNWSSVDGIPRGFAGGLIGLGEPLVAKRTAVPQAAKAAMRDRCRAEGMPVEYTGYTAWAVLDVIVVTHADWA